MKGDFTRFTFNPQDHFNRVYKQQGRAELDADFNEYVDLATDLNRTEAVDVIGQAGVPNGDGFKVEIINNNTDLLIHKGHVYVDGILCVLDNNVMYSEQPDDIGPAPALPAPSLNRKDLVYLHVMERHITWVEDPSLLEPALQGADTCTRVKTITQIRVLSNVPANTTCGSIANWPPKASGGRLTTGNKPPGALLNPCVLPESGGFRGVENRLYRVEVHTGGSLANATFKWSRDNGAVVVPIAFITGDTHRVQAKTLGRDQVFGLKKGDWVELASDITDLTASSGTLAQIIDITSDLIVELSKDISAHNAETHPKLRRWDQGSDELAMQNGASIDLEDGVTVQFSGSDFQPGDAWMFTARIGQDVEQLNNAPPSAIIHHYAPLAIITWIANPAGPNLLQGKVEPCVKFPPLTNITASDVKFNGAVCNFGPGVKTVQQAIDALCQKEEECCTIVVHPGSNLADVFNAIPAGGAHLCFRPNPAGYQLDKRIEVTGKGAIVISGVGDAGKIWAKNDECCLRFIGCGSVTIRDLSAEGTKAQIGSGRNMDGILGVVSIKSTIDVLVENCRFTCASGPHRTTACLSVHGAERAVVRGNRFLAGVQQVGVLFSNVDIVQSEGNYVYGMWQTVVDVPSFLNDPQFLAGVRTRLISNLSVGDPAPTGVVVNVTGISVGGMPVRFLSPASHIQQWKNLLQQNPMPGNPSKSNIEDFILGVANQILNPPPPEKQILKENPPPSFLGLRKTILGSAVPAAQGITVGGTIGSSLSICNNRVFGFIEGIHVGLSAPGPNISFAERVLIRENQILVRLGTGSTRGRHGIYVGNVNSLSIRSNRLFLLRPPGTEGMQIDGIRVFGRLGRSIIIRENHMSNGFNTGIHFELRGPQPSTPMWLINDNLAEGAALVVSAPNVANKTNNWG